ncbi:uncharacterized protein LOC107135309, partial [Marmota marmota marmota]|uniref:uncharacterized protein LOC107135309 n=1 Tax=Marmota marmota marmota TaxID=9994 RepID=UPI002091EF42
GDPGPATLAKRPAGAQPAHCGSACPGRTQGSLVSGPRCWVGRVETSVDVLWPCGPPAAARRDLSLRWPPTVLCPAVAGPVAAPGLKCVVAGLVGLGQSAEGGALLRVLLGLWAPSAVCCGVLCTEHQSQRHPSHPQGWRSPCDRTRAALPAPWGPRAAWSAAAPSLSAQVCAVCPGPADRSLCPSGLRLPTVLEGASLLWSRRGAHRLSVRPQVRGHVEKVRIHGLASCPPQPPRSSVLCPPTPASGAGGWLRPPRVPRILQNCHDEAAKFVHLLMNPGCNYLVQEDFVPFLQVSVAPGGTPCPDARRPGPHRCAAPGPPP